MIHELPTQTEKKKTKVHKCQINSCTKTITQKTDTLQYLTFSILDIIYDILTFSYHCD